MIGGQPNAVVVSGTRYVYGLQQAMYTTATIPILPAVIAQTTQGDTTLLASSATGKRPAERLIRGHEYFDQLRRRVPLPKRTCG